MENLDPTSPPNQGWEMARFCHSRGFILDLGGGWGFAVQFYFAQDCRYNECDNVTISRHKMILLLKFACNTDLGLKNWFHD